MQSDDREEKLYTYCEVKSLVWLNRMTEMNELFFFFYYDNKIETKRQCQSSSQQQTGILLKIYFCMPYKCIRFRCDENKIIDSYASDFETATNHMSGSQLCSVRRHYWPSYCYSTQNKEQKLFFFCRKQ